MVKNRHPTASDKESETDPRTRLPKPKHEHEPMPRHQLFMGSVYTAMGLGTMFFPCTVIGLSFSPSFIGTRIGPALELTMRCFGAQASLCGLLILTSKFTRQTYQAFGVAMIPFFVFDWYVWYQGSLTTFGAIGDALGNTIFSICCFIGASM